LLWMPRRSEPRERLSNKPQSAARTSWLAASRLLSSFSEAAAMGASPRGATGVKRPTASIPATAVVHPLGAIGALI
jgi:hypothetical protein